MHTLLSDLLAKPPALPPAITGHEKIVLYGAGNLGVLALDFLAHLGITPLAVLDRNAPLSTQPSGDIPVMRPEGYPAEADVTVLVTIGTMAYAPIAESLRTAGWANVLPFYDYAEHFRDRHPLNNGWFSGSLTDEDRTHIASLPDMWADDGSRRAYLQFLAWRYAREEWVFPEAPIDASNRFFIPEISCHLHADEVFIDAGAYDGRVLQRFLDHTGGMRAAHVFEADVANYAQLAHAVAALPDSMRLRVHLHAQALSNRNGKISFSGGFGMASRADAQALTRVQATCLDALALAPTFMKLHLEGGELAALEGSLITLTAHRPMLAITVYHTRDGLWKTADWLRHHLPRYRFYFRLHAWCGTGAVIYAVPEER
ncbi:MAG: FkbM family methyltransferase [Alphaproteobacteria bacterium]|nr:FkbM family methyltransferase [Alphaproteobacteria bacterium]